MSFRTKFSGLNATGFLSRHPHLRTGLDRLLTWLRRLFPIVMLLFLAHSLASIGWIEVLRSRPQGIAFYLIQFAPYALLPVSEWLIYRRLLGVPGQLPLYVLFCKRYLNSMMVEYSGEAYFFFWAQKNLRITRDNLLHVVRDSALLSGGAGLVMVWLVVAIFLSFGGMSLPPYLVTKKWALLAAGMLPLVPCLVLMLGGSRVTLLTRAEMALTFCIHLGRSGGILFLEFLSWWFSGALPSAIMCLEFVAIRLVVTRLPLLPGKDLVFMGVGIEAAGMMDLSRSRVAAVLIIMTVFQQALDFVVVGIPWLLRANRNRVEAP